MTQSLSRLACTGRRLGVVAAAMMLSGCGVSSLTSDLGSSVFGGGSSQAASDGTVSEEQLLSAAKASEALPGATGAVDVTAGCPKVIVAPRDKAITVYEPGRVGDGLAVMHRAEITKTARECHIEGGKVFVKYGFSGRVLLGPRGQSGLVSMPVAVAVTDSKRERVAGDKLKVDTSVAIENPIGYFSAVRVVTFDVPEGSRPGDFELTVGFERTVPNSG